MSKEHLLNLHKFNPKILEYNRLHSSAPTCIIIGKRNSGKTVLTTDLLYYMRNAPIVVAMCGTMSSVEDLSKHIHGLFIYEGFREDVLIKLINHQKDVANELRKQGRQLKSEPSKGVVLIFDDLAYDKDLMKNKSMRELFFNGRHLGVSCFITTQYCMVMGPEYRANIDYLFVIGEILRNDMEKLWKNFFSQFDSIADFKTVLNSCTEDYSTLVTSSFGKTSKIEDQIFWYKATLGHDYRISAGRWKEWNMELKNESEQELDSEETSYKNSKKTSKIQIKKLGPKAYNDDDDID